MLTPPQENTKIIMNELYVEALEMYKIPTPVFVVGTVAAATAVSERVFVKFP
jgi:hypothetical protein